LTVAAAIELVEGNHHKLIASERRRGAETQPVALEPGRQASIQLDWTGWCNGPSTHDLSVVVSLPSGFGSTKIPSNFGVPPCASPGATSLLCSCRWS
jgi:hypothetical protein